MSENTKMPPNQDQRQRMPPGKPAQKPGGPAPSGAGPDRDRVSNPGKQGPEIDPDRVRPDRNRPIPGKEVPGSGSGGGSMDDDLDEGVTPPIDRE